MTKVDITALQSLVGKLPGGGVPASWWISTDADVIAKFYDWADKDLAYRERVKVLGDELGVEKWMRSGFDGSLRGFIPPRGMGEWESHPQYVPVPDGWRIDKKRNLLVPSRRTKADRESEANRRFAELGSAPKLETPGMPSDLWVDDRIYGMSIRRGDACVMAFCGGDPDRLTAVDKFEVDETLWQRQSLSTFHLLREVQAVRS